MLIHVDNCTYTHTHHIYIYTILVYVIIDRFDVLGHKARAFEDLEGDSTDNVYDIT